MAQPIRVKSTQLQICNALYEGGYRLNGAMFKPEMFTSMKEMLDKYIIYDADIYTYLVEKGLIHKPYCLLCGEDLDDNKGKFDFLGRYYFMCSTCYDYYSPKKDKLKEGCYIATACYGSYEHPDVLILRRFRDKVLSQRLFGKLFIEIYYLLSPHIAKRLKNMNKLNMLIKEVLLKPIVKKLK